MKQNNGCLIIISILMFVGFLAITMDTTVDTGFGGRVHNLGLMNDKTNLIIVVGVLLVGAIIFLVFSASQSNTNLSNTSPFTSLFKEVEVDYLQERNGIAYEKNADNPFTGKLTIRYDNGQKKEEVNFKNGQKHGLFTKWHDNGQKKEEVDFRNGQITKRWCRENNVCLIIAILMTVGLFALNFNLGLVFFSIAVMFFSAIKSMNAAERLGVRLGEKFREAIKRK